MVLDKGIHLNLGCGADVRLGYVNVDMEDMLPIPNATFIRRPIDALDWVPDGCADTVTALEVIEHLEDFHGTLHEWTKKLKAGGKLIVSFPDYSAVMEKLVELDGVADEHDWFEQANDLMIYTSMFGDVSVTQKFAGAAHRVPTTYQYVTDALAECSARRVENIRIIRPPVDWDWSWCLEFQFSAQNDYPYDVQQQQQQQQQEV